MPDAVVDREALPRGFGTLPLTRLVLAPYAFDSDGRGTSPLAELRGLAGLRELVLDRCQVKVLPTCCRSSAPEHHCAALTTWKHVIYRMISDLAPSQVNDMACELPAAQSLSGVTLTSISLRESTSIAGHLPPFMDWNRMVSADLSQCRLQCISECILQAPNLKELDLTLNDLEVFPSRADWPRLEVLKLSHNRLSSLPEVAAPSLRILDLSYNAALLQLRDRDVTMLTKERWPHIMVLDLDRGKTVDIEQGGKRLLPPRWTLRSLICAFEALGRVEVQRDVRLILHRGPVAAHECVLTVADVRDEAGNVLAALDAFARRFEQ